jgi:hypothetical protein
MEKEEKKKTKDYLNPFTCQSHILNIGPRIHWTWNFNFFLKFKNRMKLSIGL